MHTVSEHTHKPLLNAIVARAVLLTSSIDGHVAEVWGLSPHTLSTFFAHCTHYFGTSSG